MLTETVMHTCIKQLLEEVRLRARSQTLIKGTFWGLSVDSTCNPSIASSPSADPLCHRAGGAAQA